MLGLRRATVASGATLAPSDQIVVQVADMQVSSHRPTVEIVEINDLNVRSPSQ